MVPLEWMMILFWLCFAIVGLARQFPRELGATIVFTGMILAFDLAGTHLGNLTFSILSKLGLASDENLVKWFVYSLIIVAVICWTYIGETLSYSGVWAPGPILGRVFDVFIGLFNGWLVLGTWWYYSNALSYPMQKLGWFVAPLDALATELLKWLPLSLVPDQGSTIYITAFLLFLLLLKVIR
jgi:uncharacterized membrane protein required for colicin V production